VTVPNAPEGGRRAAWGRTFALDGIEILSRAKGGDGRTVEAYAAVFGQPTEVHDQHGDYFEDIHRSAFNRTINGGGARNALVLYNHGMNVVDGRVDSLAQVPLGSPVNIEADNRGLRTVTRYNKSALADSVLESIKNDDIKGYSFRGTAYRSTPEQVPRARAGAALPTVTRMELGLRDYGPTPRPYYEGAEIVAIRSTDAILSELTNLGAAELDELIRALTATRQGDPAVSTATPAPGPGTEDPSHGRSGRMSQFRLRAGMIIDRK
jgi:HK97 family phage prohead protease